MRVKCPKCERTYPIAQGDAVMCPCGHQFPVKGNEVKLPELFCDEDFSLQLREVSDEQRQEARHTQMDDIEYFRMNLYAALGIPPELR